MTVKEFIEKLKALNLEKENNKITAKEFIEKLKVLNHRKEKTIYCCYKGYLTVPNDFECSYCDECDFCSDNSYTYYEEE